MLPVASIPKGWKLLRLLSFEALIGALAFVSGGLALLHYGGIGADVLSMALPGWLTTTSSALYLLAGAALIAGLVTGRRNVEAFGLVVIVASVVVRSIALFAVLGLSSLVVTSYIFNTVVVWACIERLLIILRGAVILLSEDKA